MIRFADCITLGQIRQALDLLDCELAREGNDYIVQPITKRPGHTNANVMKFPHRRMQYIGAQPCAQPTHDHDINSQFDRCGDAPQSEPAE